MLLAPGDKIIAFTDIHLGLRGNEKRHNEECAAFVNWLIDIAKERNIKKSVFAGDWHHQRSSIQTCTLNYTNKIFKCIDNYFDDHYHIIGNHDMFYKHKRDIVSVIAAENFSNIHMINKITTVGNVTMVPWLVSAEYKKLSNIKTKYIFGHFEFPGYLMNAMVTMPDVGKLNANHFKNPNQEIYSGHFHKRQTKKNEHGSTVTYFGNCFPHNFADDWDDDRGIMILEYDKPPEFIKWPKAPKYRTMHLSQLLENAEEMIDKFTNARITVDMDLTYEDANFIRDEINSVYNPREISFMPIKEEVDQEVIASASVFETVDQIVIEQLQKLDTKTMDSTLLIEIYNSLEI